MLYFNRHSDRFVDTQAGYITRYGLYSVVRCFVQVVFIGPELWPYSETFAIILHVLEVWFMLMRFPGFVQDTKIKLVEAECSH
jgi:hypothetical protein